MFSVLSLCVFLSVFLCRCSIEDKFLLIYALLKLGCVRVCVCVCVCEREREREREQKQITSC